MILWRHVPILMNPNSQCWWSPLVRRSKPLRFVRGYLARVGVLDVDHFFDVLACLSYFLVVGRSGRIVSGRTSPSTCFDDGPSSFYLFGRCTNSSGSTCRWKEGNEKFGGYFRVSRLHAGPYLNCRRESATVTSKMSAFFGYLALHFFSMKTKKYDQSPVAIRQ